MGDVVRYSRGSKAIGVEGGDYARVEHVDAKTNHVTVRTDDERTPSYDPRRLQGVTIYRETERAFAVGDRVQMTAPDRERGVANRELGTIERIDTNGRMRIRWDSGQTSSFEAGERRHLDYSYALTSHSSQGHTAGRVLVHVETERASEKLVNQRMAYVALSRGQYDTRIYTDDKVNSPELSTATCRIDQRWREHRRKHRDKAKVARSRGVNRSVTRWPSVRYETTVLSGYLGPRHRAEKLTRCRQLLAATPSLAPSVHTVNVTADLPRLAVISIRLCPGCGQGQLIVIDRLPPTGRPSFIPDTS